MIKKEIKINPRKKGANTNYYRINMAKKDYEDLGKYVYILSPNEYNKLQIEIEKRKNTEIIKNTRIANLENELKGLKSGIKEYEKSLVKPLKNLLKKDKYK